MSTSGRIFGLTLVVAILGCGSTALDARDGAVDAAVADVAAQPTGDGAVEAAVLDVVLPPSGDAAVDATVADVAAEPSRDGAVEAAVVDLAPDLAPWGGEVGSTDWSRCDPAATRGAAPEEYCRRVYACSMPLHSSLCVASYAMRSPAEQACQTYQLCRATLPPAPGAPDRSNLDQFCPAVRGNVDPCGIYTKDAGADR